jgi:hypothetical protein
VLSYLEPSRAWICRCLLVVLVWGSAAFGLCTERVDLLLVLASDDSRSVDHQKFILQREGHAAAGSDPRVLAAIRSGSNDKIAINFVA